MSHSIHRGWGYKLVSWIPGLGSSNANMAQNLVFTEAFEHRYASPKRLLEILQNQPFSFQENEIQINVSLVSFCHSIQEPPLIGACVFTLGHIWERIKGQATEEAQLGKCIHGS